MIIAKIVYKNKIPKNYEADPGYLKYERLLDQYFEIKNDKERLLYKFNEITMQHQKLVHSGIIGV